MNAEKTHLITGAAGYIGYFLCKSLLEKGFKVVGLDNINDYYDINLKQERLNQLKLFESFTFIKKQFNRVLNIIEACRQYPVSHLIFASSSSVYGANNKVPFSESDPADNPVSLYAATKKSNELMAYTYSHLYKIPTTGLRFFYSLRSIRPSGYGILQLYK